MSDSGFTSAVMYCDGGFMLDSKSMYNNRTNLGSIGIHAYTYNNEAPKKGTGNPKVIPTANGYMTKAESEGTAKVTVGHYLDISGGYAKGYNSSNQTELRALMEGCKWLLADGAGLTDVKIFSDSKYTVQGSNDWLDKWRKNGWRTATGVEIKNKQMWIEAGDLLQLVKRQCVDGFSLEWVRGHNGNIGNEQADGLATKGLALAANGITDLQIKLSDIQGYWKTDNESPRILQAPRWYCSTTDLDYVDKDGRFIYMVGCHGSKDKEDELAGKRYADNYLGVVKISEPDPVMEDLRKRYIKSDPKQLSNLLITHLDVLFNPKQYRELKELGWNYTIDKLNRIEKLNSNGAIIVTEMDPKGQGFRMVDVWKTLLANLDEIHEGSDKYRSYDLTDIFFDMDAKKDVYKIKPTMTQLVKHIDVKAPFNLAKAKEDPDVKEYKVRLILGADILSRNQLAGIAADIETIQLVTWRESDAVGRYATYVKLRNGDHGIWCRYDSNMIIVKS